MCRVSFIVPVYNCKDYLQRCVESIDKIGLREFEILLIDDGSTDGSDYLCDSIASSNNYVLCIHQTNAGVSAARNVGMDKASGDYIIFVDADDTVDSLRMREAIDCLDSNQIDLAIYGISFDFYYKGRIYRKDELGTPLSGIVERTEWIQCLEQLYFANALSPIWNKIYRRQFLLDNQLKLREDMFLYEDLEYSLRCLGCCEQILFFPDVIYHYRQSEDEGNAGRRLKRIASLSDLIGKIESALARVLKSETGAKSPEQMNRILVSLYLVLAREKISVSDRNEVGQICDDFRIWFETRDIMLMDDQKEYAEFLLGRKVNSLILKKSYVAFRHKIAVFVKGVLARMKM